MGNVVIRVNKSQSQSSTNTLEVYRDISMISRKFSYSDQTRRLEKSVNVEAVYNSLRNIFTWIPGERVLLPDFGSRLREMIYEQITDENVEQIISEIRGVCLKYEPRVEIVKIVNVSSIDDTENNTIRLQIIFTIPSLGPEQYNYSYICNTSD